MILELEIYAPYRLPGASVRFVPFQATIPPPHARLASVTFSNQLHRVHHANTAYETGLQTLTPFRNRIDLRDEVSGTSIMSILFPLTIRLPVDDAVHDVGARVSAGVPRVLEARERAPVERRVRVRDVRHQCLRNGEVCLRSKMCQRQPTRAPHTYIICVTRSSVLEVDVVRLEVDVAEEGLEGRASRPGADE